MLLLTVFCTVYFSFNSVANISFTLVLPELPVKPTTFVILFFDNFLRQIFAISPRALRVFCTVIIGTFTLSNSFNFLLLITTTAAPFLTASFTKQCPSSLFPLIAINKEPLVTFFESITTL